MRRLLLIATLLGGQAGVDAADLAQADAAWREFQTVLRRVQPGATPDPACLSNTAGEAEDALASCIAAALRPLGEGAQWLRRQALPTTSSAAPPRAELRQGRLWLQASSLPLGDWGQVGEPWLRALEGLEPEQAQELLLDLRGNGGGSVLGVLQAAWLLMPAERVALRIENADGSSEPLQPPEPRRTGASSALWTWRQRLLQLPLQVWIDGQTAMGAEALALLLQRQRGARLVGQRSAGKHLVRSLMPLLRSDSVLILPSGRLSLGDGSQWPGGLSPELDWDSSEPPPPLR